MDEHADVNMAAHTQPNPVVDILYYIVAAFFFVYLFIYFVTSAGGPSLLASTLVPITFVLFTLNGLREGGLYPTRGRTLNYVIAAIYCAVSIAISIYMNVEFEEIGTVRAGFWNTPDLVVGGTMAVLVLEYSRKRFFPLFVINVVLIVYCVYGWIVPGTFHHPGLEWERVVTAMSVESSTGVFSQLPQLALTLIGSFVLVLASLRAFGCIDSILKAAGMVAARSAHALPLSAVLGSLGIGAVSGSGAANAITTGSATVPAMIGAGMPREKAAAIESAASLGSQLMPPVMGISAFLMADFMGVSYFDVVARGYAPAIVYFLGVATGTYLLSVRHGTSQRTLGTEPMRWTDWVNLGAFVVVVGALAGAATSLLKVLADPYDQLPAITFWLLGSLAAMKAEDILAAAPLAAVAMLPLALLRWRINVLTMGDEEAKALGVDAGRLRVAVIGCATLMTAAVVSISGVVGWVGLVIPHIARMIVGPSFAVLLPASILLGAAYMVIVDTLARTIATVEVPLGILTAIIGAPVFIWLLARGRRGWT